MSLCEDCGLCCDGTLFASVRVEADAAARLRSHHLPLVRTAQAETLVQPCPALDGVLCSVYAQRPTRCRSYVCELLRDVDSGRVSATYARTIIDRTRELHRTVRSLLPRHVRWWGAVARLQAGPPVEATDLTRALEALAHLVRTRFWQ